MGANSVLSSYMYCYEKELKTPTKLTVNNEQRPQTTSYTGMMESRVYHRSFYMLHCWEQGLKFIPAVKKQFNCYHIYQTVPSFRSCGAKSEWNWHR